MEQNTAPVRRERGRKFVVKPKVCTFCTDKNVIDYKNFSLLQRFVSDRGKIVPRRRTGVCARHQRGLAQAIKRARYLALLPAAPNHVYNMATERK
jgi:small subunit ribosomal protein S18